MGSRLHLAMAATVCIVVLACTDADLPLETDHEALAPNPQPSIVTFGMTVLGDPEVQNGANAVNDQGQVLFTRGPEPLRPFVWTNGALLTLLHPFDADGVQGLDLNTHATAVGDVDFRPAAWVGGELTLLDLPAEYASGQAVAVNDAGQIVGTASVVNVGVVPVFWPDKDAAMVVLHRAGRTEDVNNAGAIVGQAVNEAGTLQVGAYWASPTSTPQPLKGPDGQPCGAPSGINDRGEIVGFCRSSAAYWSSPDADAVLLGGESHAFSINELGQIVGSTRNGSSDFRPTLWHREGAAFRAFDLGMPADQEEALAREINNRGRAVGSAFGGFKGVGLVWEVPVRVEIDVVPGPVTTVKLGKGTVSVALLGSQWFHVGDIDAATLSLGNDDGLETPVAGKKGTPSVRLTDVDRDGYRDLLASFDKQTMTRSGDLVVGAQTLIVQGRLRDGTRLRGADAVTGVR